ncbi:MAG: NAD-dependent epimerase/dehydratase family protein [Armatimonadota bacterium]
MKVLVTGGSGNVGGYVVAEIKGKHDVTILDMKPSEKHPEIPVLQVDLLNLDETVDKVKGFDAVIHLAAIPNPNNDPGDRVLGVNTVSTYNILEAVRINGISRIVYACSESASGFGIHKVSYKPEYLPVDEKHPSWPHETYSISKYFGEVLTQEWSRAYGIEAVSLRYGWVWFGHDHEELRNMFKSITPSAENCFGAYVFAEDVAQACSLSLDYKFNENSKFESFYILADDTFLNMDSMKQIGLLYGDNPPPVRKEYFLAKSDASFFDCTKAKTKLGYKPALSWRDL